MSICASFTTFRQQYYHSNVNNNKSLSSQSIKMFLKGNFFHKHFFPQVKTNRYRPYMECLM